MVSLYFIFKFYKMKKINIGIIGKNFGYKVIYNAVKKIKFYNTIAFSFRKKKNFQINKKIIIYKDWKKMLANKRIKAVIIASPPETHFDIIKEALKRKLHIFCEKPVTKSYKQISQICDLVKKKNIKHLANFEFPKIKAFQYLKRKIINKLKINKVTVTWAIRINQNNRSSWKNIHTKGGGILYNYICHSLYYLEYLFGKMIFIESNYNLKRNSKGIIFKFYNNFKKFKILIFFQILPTKSKKNPIHKLKIFSNKGSISLSSKTKNLNDRFSIKKMNKIIFKEKEEEEDFRLKPTFENLKIFEKSICSKRLKKPNFLDAKRIHFFIHQMTS